MRVSPQGTTVTRTIAKDIGNSCDRRTSSSEVNPSERDIGNITDICVVNPLDEAGQGLFKEGFTERPRCEGVHTEVVLAAVSTRTRQRSLPGQSQQ